MNIKHIKLSWVLCLALLGTPYVGLKAQQSGCVTPMMILVPEQTDPLGPTAQAELEAKLRQAVTRYGIEGGAKFANFCIVANIIEGQKEVIAGKRPLVTLTFDLEIFVGNNYTGEKFAATSIRLNGSGNNENKAYTAALRSINANNNALQSFLRDAKKKVDEYYATQIPVIISQAKAFALRHEYEEALCLLASVPTCAGAYGDVEDTMVEVFQQFVDYDCAMKVSKARAIWNAGQNREAAELAGAYLAAIDPSAACWGDALVLANQIHDRIGDDWEFYKEMQRAEVDLEKARIEAMRAIGVAYGQNQKANTISEHWIVR